MAETAKEKFRDVKRMAGKVREKVEGEAKELSKAKDPVCGTKIDKDYATATSLYHGKTYYFDTISCRERFDINPDRYV